MGLLTKLGSSLFSGAKNIAAGRAQANLGVQSPHLAGAAVRLGRFFYMSCAGWITISWYSGYVNQRVSISESWLTKFIIPGSTKPVISPPDRPNKGLPTISKISSPGGKGAIPELVEGAKELLLGVSNTTVPSKGRKLVPITQAQLGTPGLTGYLWSAPSKQIPEYNAARYRALLEVASAVGKQYGLRLTSSYRPQSTGSLHGDGLAFDMVGRTTDMKRAASWAAQNPGLFQEIFIHDAGSGMHLHLGFYPDAADIYNSTSNKYNRASGRAAPSPTASRVRPTLV